MNTPQLHPLKMSHIEDLQSFVDPEDRERVLVIAEAIRFGGISAMIAERGGRAIGWAVVHTRLRPDLGWMLTEDTVRFQAEENAYLEHLHVRSEERGKGTGKLLLEAIEKDLKQAGKKRLWLHVRKGNVRAQNFYLRNGWIFEKEKEAEWQPGCVMAIFYKHL